MKTALLGLLLATVALASGCASIVNGSNQSISVEARSDGRLVKNATCKLTNDKGTWYVDTPGSVTVHRSYDDLSIRCDKDNYDSGLATVKSSTKAMMFGNILFGGIIGGAVDAGTGAGYDYPALVTVVMGATTTIEAPQGVPQAQTTTLANPAMQRGVSEPTPAAASAAPGTGALWNYQFSQRLFAQRTAKISVRADRIDGDFVEESIFQPGGSGAIVRRTVNTREARFLHYAVGKETELVEFAPYLMLPQQGKAAANSLTPLDYVVSGRTNDWQDEGHRESVERVTVPAGTYQSVHYQISGRRSALPTAARMAGEVERYQVDVWYAAEVGRIVKLHHRAWSGPRPIEDDVVELVEYRGAR